MSNSPYYVKPIYVGSLIAKPIYRVTGLLFKHVGYKVVSDNVPSRIYKDFDRPFLTNVINTHQADMTRIALNTVVTS